MGVGVMKVLETGLSVGEVAVTIQEDDEVPSDIADFVQTLMEYGLVAEIDGQQIAVTVQEDEQRQGIEVFRGLQSRHVRGLCGAPAFVVYTAMLVISALLLFLRPQLIPTSDNFFVLPWSYAVNTLLMMAVSFSLIFVHELGHLCAARTMGVDGRLSVGRRLYNLFAQCTIGSAWQLPRSQRLIFSPPPFLSTSLFFFPP